MNLRPMKNQAIIETISRGESFYNLDEEGKTKSGIFVKAPEIQGIPNMGVIRAIAANELGLEVGQKVTFEESSPRAFRWEDKTMFAVPLDKITGALE